MKPETPAPFNLNVEQFVPPDTSEPYIAMLVNLCEFDPGNEGWKNIGEITKTLFCLFECWDFALYGNWEARDC